MPDWSYHPLKKLLLSKMPAKTSRAIIHNSMNTIASIPGGRRLIEFLGHMRPSGELKTQIGEISFPTPIGLSGLVDPDLSGLKAFQELGFSFIEIGPIVLKENHKAPPEWSTDHKRIQFSQQKQEKVLLKNALQKLTQQNIRIPIIARLDDKLTENEWMIIVQQLTPFVDAFIMNNDLINQNIKVKVERPIFVKSKSDELNNKITSIKKLAESKSINGVILDAPQQEEGDYFREVDNANQQLVESIRYLKREIPNIKIMTSGGVQSPEEANKLSRAGVDLMLLSTGYVQAGPGLPKRIHERLLFEKKQTEIPEKLNQWHWSFLFGLAILIGGLFALYFAFTSVILPYDESFLGMSRWEILMVNPLLLSFMSHDRMALAGTMISGGIIYIQLARYGIKYGLHWAKTAYHTAAIIGFLGIFLFLGYGYFDWLHGVFWLLLLPIYYLSFREGKTANQSPISKHGTNDHSWQLGLIGQLMFIILGFAIVVGGIVISTIGVTNVFVSTDISFLCMPAQTINSINEKLIPVIAHDRAGFGSALVCVGLLVLMLSLWGFRQGEKWIWNTLAIGALPAFIAGLGTHILIGYTTFIHLLPVYFLIALYLLGLVFSYRFLKK